MSIYLDNASKTKPKKEVLDVITNSLVEDWFNPSSSYQPSVEVKDKVNQARKIIADKINAKPNEIFFTSGGCEGNSLILNSFKVIYYDPLSHESVIDIINKKNKYSDCGECEMFVDKQGKLMTEKLDLDIDNFYRFDPKAYMESRLITVCGANNEIGTIQPLKKIKEIIEFNKMNFKDLYEDKKHFYFHVDGTQMLPCMKIDVKELGVDAMTFSGAKIGCPSGIGFVYIQEDFQKYIDPIIHGTQENGMRGGTENVPYILGLAKAMQLLDTDTSHLESVRDYFINKLLTLPNTHLVGSKTNRLANNINICFGNIDATALLSYLNLNGIYASSGSACNSNSLEPSHVLKKLGMSDIEANSCVRFTLSNEITIEELEEAFNVIERFVTRQNRYLKGGELI